MSPARRASSWRAAGLVLGAPRLVAQLHRLVEVADLGQVRGERLAQRRDEPAAGAPDLRSEPRPAASPTAAARRAPCRLLATSAAAGCAAAGHRHRRRRPSRSAATSARRRGRGSDAAAPARPSSRPGAPRREHEHGGALGQGLYRRAGRTVHARPLGRAWLEADRPGRRCAAQRAGQLDARDLRADADDARIVRGVQDPSG